MSSAILKIYQQTKEGILLHPDPLSDSTETRLLTLAQFEALQKLMPQTIFINIIKSEDDTEDRI